MFDIKSESAVLTECVFTNWMWLWSFSLWTYTLNKHTEKKADVIYSLFKSEYSHFKEKHRFNSVRWTKVRSNRWAGTNVSDMFPFMCNLMSLQLYLTFWLCFCIPMRFIHAVSVQTFMLLSGLIVMIQVTLLHFILFIKLQITDLLPSEAFSQTPSHSQKSSVVQQRDKTDRYLSWVINIYSSTPVLMNLSP